MTRLSTMGVIRALLAACALAVLAACGGGASGDGGDTPPPDSQVGSLTLGLAGGAPSGYEHVWVTIDAIALNADADRPWSPTDSSWQVVRLDAPVTVDLNASVNGVIASLMAGRLLPAGTYGQMRLFTLRHDDALAASASELQLAYNNQVEDVDVVGSPRVLPLEFADAALGLRIAGPFVISPNVSTDLTLQWDMEHSLVRFSADDGIARVTMRPDLRWYDIAQTGAIIGLMDKSAFCPAGVSTGCVHDVVATAQALSPDGRFMASVRSTPVVVGDTYAAFALYPLPALPSGGSFDVVIRGRNMRTMVIRHVPASAADLLEANPTQLGVDMSDPAHPVPAPLVPALSAQGDAQLVLAAPTSPASAQLLFGQTLAGSGELPHEVMVANTDPFTGLLAEPAVLPGGPLRVATYAGGAPLVFGDETPQEGSDAFSLTTMGTRYDDPSAIATVLVPGGSTTSIAAPAATRKAGIAEASLTVTLSGGSTQAYDAAELVVADVGGIVATQDVSALIGVNGAQTTLLLPAGPVAAAQGGTAVYSVSVRAWKRAAPLASVQWARAGVAVDLRSASSAAVALTLP